MGYICLKTTFPHLKLYLQIYLTLLLTDLRFGKCHEEYGKFSPEHFKVSKLSLKSTEELSVMKMKNDANFEEELTCHFKVDMQKFDKV